MARTKAYACKNCGRPFTARVADRARGWARYCSKSCKAKEQTRKNGYSAGEASRFEKKPPKFHCSECGDPAKKYLGAGEIEYLCDHHAALWSHPFSSEGLGQS